MSHPRYLRVAKWTGTFALALAATYWATRPQIAALLYKEDYKSLAFQCDMAMHDEAAIRSYDDSFPGIEQLRASADVQLLVCHEYDKLRKKMLLLGVSDNQLALYALESIEIEMIPLDRLVDQHRMPRF
jgi:hypothetical protein